MKKALIITGPTATGKTALALQLAEKLSADIISVDSRQIYEGLDIGTGKDIPEGAQKVSSDIKWKGIRIPYYQKGQVKIWGYDLILPDATPNVSQYLEALSKVLPVIESEKKTPIFVGGTGFYIRALTKNLETVLIPPDFNLRNRLKDQDTAFIYERLNDIDKRKALSLNVSDKQNSYRLIRAIEIAQWKKSHRMKRTYPFLKDYSVLKIGLTAPKEILIKRIRQRLQKRIDQGLINEIRNLLRNGIDWNSPALQTLGYKEWKDYIENQVPEEEIKERWFNDEVHYLKRQITWFKNESDIHWFNIMQEGWHKSVEIIVQAWYSE